MLNFPHPVTTVLWRSCLRIILAHPLTLVSGVILFQSKVSHLRQLKRCVCNVLLSLAWWTCFELCIRDYLQNSPICCLLALISLLLPSDPVGFEILETARHLTALFEKCSNTNFFLTKIRRVAKLRSDDEEWLRVDEGGGREGSTCWLCRRRRRSDWLSHSVRLPLNAAAAAPLNCIWGTQIKSNRALLNDTFCHD